MERKGIWAGAIVLVVAVGGLVWYGATYRVAQAPSPTASSTAPGVGSVEEHKAYYDITASYASDTPLATEVGATADAAAVASMKSFVEDTVAQFKKDGNFDNLTSTDITTLGFDTGRKDTLLVSFLRGSSAHTLSYIYTTYEDTGGAHGNTFFKTFVFDTSTGALLPLADLFNPGSDYLDALSQIARANLPAVIGEGADASFINPGTTPDEKNFENFFFDNDKLGLLFAPYAVAPYSSGPQTLYIPASQLNGILKSNYP